MLKLEEIDKLTELARLKIPAEEKKILRKEVGEILEYVGQIQKLSSKEPAKEVGLVHNIFREDKEIRNHIKPASLPMLFWLMRQKRKMVM
ncbi:MAG: hypothetical protein UW71_C0004G0032 [Parcubacteria group bacterium GW2011_GWB1_44_7]|nr:MAG: hypothetical protein UW71_C0004G0032 [Parcubacteria group bacterium GW2011_GWB1_44_7]